MLQTIMDALKSVDFKALERLEELGRDYNFKESVKLLKQIYSDLREIIDSAETLKIPTESENRIQSIADGTFRVIQNIQSFVLKGNEAQAPSQYNQINTEANNLYQEDLSILQPLMERISIRKLKPIEVEDQIKKASTAVKEIERIRLEAEKSKKDVDLAIKEVRDSLGKGGAIISRDDFERQAAIHKDLAIKWFWASIATIIVGIIVVIIIFNIPSLNLNNVAKDNYPRILQISIFKLVLLSIIYLLIYQTIKNYKINRHLYVLNKHRQLTLTVYPLMVNATNNQEQANTIVGQAAKAIFDPGTTGYLDPDDDQNPINLTGIINKIADKT